jgi:protein-L-isoaspartate(D-aspartate) O-methyltransferase
VAAQPLLFTIAFRKKMAELPQPDRQDWLASLVQRLGQDPASPAPPEHASRAERLQRARLQQELREVARGCRLPLVEAIERQLGPFSAQHLRALLEVPRERFVRPSDIVRSAEDTPLPLDDEGLATISAPHAYLLSFRLLELSAGDSLVELGTGSGYGAALASFVVGEGGRVTSFEIDPTLAAWARATLADHANVRLVESDAVTSASEWRSAGASLKVVVTFAVEKLPGAWLEALPEGGVLVAPVGPREKEQRLILVRRTNGQLAHTEHGAVRYVKNRSPR